MREDGRYGSYDASMSMPICRAVPAMMRNAASSERALRSFIFSFAMSATCLRESFATLILLGSFEPLAMLAAFFSRIEAGGTS